MTETCDHWLKLIHFHAAEPAQLQASTDGITYTLLKLISNGAIGGNDALLSFSCELIEMASKEQGMCNMPVKCSCTCLNIDMDAGIEQSPDGVIWLMICFALDEELDFSQFSCLINSLVAYLENQRFQDACIQHAQLLEGILQLLKRSYAVDVDEDDLQTLSQLRLKINQSLAEISGSPEFMEKHYTLDARLSQTLISWIRASHEEELQICACVVLGNLARTDDICQRMVQEFDMHRDLLSILNTKNARGPVLHAALGFLKNLAIAPHNKSYLGDAGIVPAVSRLWSGMDMMPQVQFAAVTLVRQVIASCMENIERLLSPSDDPPETHLSRLLVLFENTDSDPIKIDIGRTIVSMLRTLIPKARARDQKAITLYDRLLNLHSHVARPIGAMVVQTQWPVVRSEGWFALALMASTGPGSAAAVDCLEGEEVLNLLTETLDAEVPDGAAESDRSRITKDRDNAIILVKKLGNNSAVSISSKAG